jgi:hypothetical protein
MPSKIIRERKRDTYRCDNSSGHEYYPNGSRKETAVLGFMYRDNVEFEMCGHTCNNWSHCSDEKKFKETFPNHTKKKFNKSGTKDGYSWSITRNTLSTAV